MASLLEASSAFRRCVANSNLTPKLCRSIICCVRTGVHSCAQSSSKYPCLKPLPSLMPSQIRHTLGQMFDLVIKLILEFSVFFQCVLVSCGLCNKLPQTDQLKQQKYICSQFWRSKTQCKCLWGKIKVLAGPHSLQQLQERVCFPLLSSRGCHYSLASGHLISITASGIPPLLPLLSQISPCPFFIRDSVIAFRFHCP